MGKNQNTFEKRRREFEKKRKAEDKRSKRRLRKENPQPDSPGIIDGPQREEPSS